MSDVTWTPVIVRLSQLTPWERNPKRISKTHAARLLDLWQRLGQFQTIAIGPAGEVYDGHQRLSVLKAAHGAGYEVQALQSSRALSEKEREELTIAAHVGTVGQFDWDALSGWDAGDLQQWGFDIETLAGWNIDATNLREMINSALPEVTPEDAWQGMPEFEQKDDLGLFHTVKVHFVSEADIAVFAKLLSQTVTSNTKYIWFPEKERENLKAYRVEDAA